MIRAGVTDFIAVMQRAAADFDIGQTVALCIGGDFEYIGTEIRCAGRLLRKVRQDAEQRFDAFQVTRRAEADRKNLPRSDCFTQHFLRQRIRIKIGIHHLSGCGCRMFTNGIVVRIKLYAALRESAL